ncbi:MAG: hypothetical protein K2L18_01210 [Acetatifactor sp.]|nr:hypothetical protein [Acetatifactor sp.]
MVQADLRQGLSRQEYALRFLLKDLLDGVWAETVKKEFYNRVGTLRIALASQPVKEDAATWIPVDKWKLSAQTDGRLEIIKEFPDIYLNIYAVEMLLKADIYGVVLRLTYCLRETAY